MFKNFATKKIACINQRKKRSAYFFSLILSFDKFLCLSKLRFSGYLTDVAYELTPAIKVGPKNKNK